MSSKPTHTPATRSGVNPTNQASRPLFEVPVLPAMRRFSFLAAVAVPSSTTLSITLVMRYATSGRRTCFCSAAGPPSSSRNTGADQRPLADHDLYNYVKLKPKLHIPVMATEYPITGFDSYAPWIMMQATDYLRGDVAVKGGITPLVKTAHLAEAFRMS
mgnify:CR=1 FL=1